ncbi:MAG: hypothetical protein AVDCRST_MAG53-2691, partial [uncultured Solirubrobacteraceae bacterium]
APQPRLRQVRLLHALGRLPRPARRLAGARTRAGRGGVRPRARAGLVCDVRPGHRRAEAAPGRHPPRRRGGGPRRGGPVHRQRGVRPPGPREGWRAAGRV